ncbi:MAG: two-component regulator propeller domain-containing protein [Limisphaerales bacterium]
MSFADPNPSAGLLACLLAVILPVRSAAEGFPDFRAWGASQDLDLSFVSAATQTTDAHLWFGSPSGLFQFNGHGFRSIDLGGMDSRKDHFVTALLADRDGSLWIGTDTEGLHQFSNGRVSPWRGETGLSNDRIKCLAQDAEGTVWVGTDGGGIFRRTGDRFAPLDAPDPESLAHPTSFALERGGRLWIGFFSGRLMTVQSGRVEDIPRKGPGIKVLHVDSTDQLWIGTSAGLARFMDGRQERIPLLQADGSMSLSAFITSIHEDRFGALWVGTLTGLIRWRDGQQEFFGAADGLGNGLVTSVFADREGSVWIGTEIGDLYQLTRRKIRIMSPFPDGLPAVSALAVTRDGTLWIGGSQGIAVRPPASQRFSVPSPPPSPSPIQDVTCIGIDGRDRIWFGNRFGDWGFLEQGAFTKIDTEVFDRARASPNFFLQTATNGFLIGTEGGLLQMGPDNKPVPWSGPPLSHKDVTCAVEAPDGTLWIGTGNGLNRVRNGSVQTFIKLQPRPIEQVADLAVDPDGTVWASTYRGLWRIRGDQFFAFEAKHGGPPVGGPLVDDHAGNLWIGLGGHVGRLSKTNLHAVAEGLSPHVLARSWSGADGLRSVILATGRAGALTPDGYIHFATDKGVATIHPGEVRTNDVPPVPTIERVIVDGEPTLTHPAATTSDRRASVDPGLDLPPGYHRVDIHYAGLSYLAPQRVRYRHRLRGLSDDWEDAGTDRVASYRALPAGNYVFELIAFNDSGLPSQTPETLRVRVGAPWWRTNTFRASILALAAIAAGGIYSWRVRRLKRIGAAQQEFSRRLLDHEENERRRLAKELHDGLGQELLILRNHVALLGLQWPEAPPAAVERLREIDHASQIAVDQARAIAHNLRPAELERLGLTTALRDMIDRASASSTIDFRHAFEPVDGRLSKDEDVLLYRITQELVNNILKHSNATSARISLRAADETSLELSVADDGRGFDPEAVVRASGGRRGLGLDSVSERIAMLSGTLRIESPQAWGKGTCVRIRVPIAPRSDRPADSKPS